MTSAALGAMTTRSRDPTVTTDEPHSYRDPAAPPPERFSLRLPAAALGSLALGAGAIALTLAIWALTGHAFVLLFAACGPGLFYLLSGAPRAVEVSRDAIVIHSWARRPRRIPTSEILSIQTDDDDVFLVTSDRTTTIAIALFPHHELERFVAAARATIARP